MSRLFAVLAGTVMAAATLVAAAPDAVAADATRFFVTMPATVNPDQPVTVTVTAVDAAGGRDFNYAGTVRFTSSDDIAVLPPDYAFGTNDGGEHVFGGIVFRQQGVQTLKVTDLAKPAITGQAETRVGNATTQTLKAELPNGARLREPATIVVTAIDNLGNVDANYRGSVHFTSTDNIATLPGDYQFTAADAGRHSFTNGVVFRTNGPQRIHVQDAANPSIYADAEIIIGTYPTPVASSPAPAGSPGAPAAAPSGADLRYAPQANPSAGTTPPAIRSAVPRRGSLPFTGAGTKRLVAMGLTMLFSGLLLVAGRRLRRASQT